MERKCLDSHTGGVVREYLIFLRALLRQPFTGHVVAKENFPCRANPVPFTTDVYTMCCLGADTWALSAQRTESTPGVPFHLEDDTNTITAIVWRGRAALSSIMRHDISDQRL